jgi:molybdate transport system substrate-binding protein
MEIRVYSGAAPRAALEPLAARFEQATGNTLAITFDGVAAIRERLGAGEKTDLVLLPTPMLEAMGTALVAGSRTLLARSPIGVAVRKGATEPDLSTPDAVRKTLLDARSIAYSDPKLAPSGIHLAKVIANLGIAEAVLAKTVLRTPFEGGVGLVAKGEVAIGFYLVSEIQASDGVTLAGLLPAELQSYVIYAGAVAARSPVQEAALAFLKFLGEPAARDQWQAAGFESVPA